MKNNKPKIVDCRWSEFKSLCVSLSFKIKKEKIDSIYGIPRGGLIPAVVISHLTGIKLVTSEKEIKKNTLIIDDLCDTGSTLKKYKNNMTAVLFLSDQSKFQPTFFGQKIRSDVWIKFFFETDKSTGI